MVKDIVKDKKEELKTSPLLATNKSAPHLSQTDSSKRSQPDKLVSYPRHNINQEKVQVVVFKDEEGKECYLVPMHNVWKPRVDEEDWA